MLNTVVETPYREEGDRHATPQKQHTEGYRDDAMNDWRCGGDTLAQATDGRYVRYGHYVQKGIETRAIRTLRTNGHDMRAIKGSSRGQRAHNTDTVHKKEATDRQTCT